MTNPDWDGYGDGDEPGYVPTAPSGVDDFGVSDEDIKKLGIEREMLGGLTPSAQAKKILDDASPMAAMQLVRLAQHATSETVRLRASTEILNRTGVNDSNGAGDGREPWDQLFDKVVKTVEDFANQAPMGPPPASGSDE